MSTNTAGTKNVASNQVDLFGGSLIDFMDEPTSVPTESKNVSNSATTEADLFADATFVSASPEPQGTSSSHDQVILANCISLYYYLVFTTQLNILFENLVLKKKKKNLWIKQFYIFFIKIFEIRWNINDFVTCNHVMKQGLVENREDIYSVLILIQVISKQSYYMNWISSSHHYFLKLENNASSLLFTITHQLQLFWNIIYCSNFQALKVSLRIALPITLLYVCVNMLPSTLCNHKLPMSFHVCTTSFPWNVHGSMYWNKIKGDLLLLIICSNRYQQNKSIHMYLDILFFGHVHVPIDVSKSNASCHNHTATILCYSVLRLTVFSCEDLVDKWHCFWFSGMKPTQSTPFSLYETSVLLYKLCCTQALAGLIHPYTFISLPQIHPKININTNLFAFLSNRQFCSTFA